MFQSGRDTCSKKDEDTLCRRDNELHKTDSLTFSALYAECLTKWGSDNFDWVLQLMGVLSVQGFSVQEREED